MAGESEGLLAAEPAARRDGPASRACSVPALGRIAEPRRHARAADRPVEWLIAEEVPVAMVYNGRSRMVMMASPADLEDFGIGFSVTEEIITRAEDIEAIEVVSHDDGFAIEMTVDMERVAKWRLKRRGITGRTGCGLCGVSTLRDAVRKPHRIEAPLAVGRAAAERALAALPDWQPMNSENRSVHAAAWCSPDGEILEAREDVGRHNALDKLIGSLLRSGRDPSAGFVALSSRCSFELVQKAAAVGVPYLVTISAPTVMALSLAEAAGMRLAARAPDGIIEFDGVAQRN
ncbi:FdhD protein [Tistlia consotensis]|uniref:Sulfur carrier protein FdhD n=2 Tax=Tistlia TaxID=1321364 RepID=A0A1Y6CD97_9PROT|nr:FdhD protein [Tistlia consotensis USBA 355]SNR88854.1 FdhD protein [Tistlia consotensis]